MGWSSGWAGVGPAGQLGRHLGFLLPVVAVAVGAFLAWSQLDANERGRWAGRSRRGRFLAVARPVVGVVLATVGVVALATQGQGFDVVLTSALAAVAVLVGATVIALPWVVRMWQGLQAEQTERIRATERADIAAHLHDSVLQTLALVQRRADDPATVIRLARSQERELREWLYADQNRSTDSLASAVTNVTHEVEDEHGIPIEVVVTGDRPMDDGGQALVKATREALLNAVRHGAAPVSVYVEVGPSGVEAFVRDHGPGFEMGDIADDRLGVRESILGRMRRHGGAAKIRRLESGTEIELTLPAPREGRRAVAGRGGGRPKKPVRRRRPEAGPHDHPHAYGPVEGHQPDPAGARRRPPDVPLRRQGRARPGRDPGRRRGARRRHGRQGDQGGAAGRGPARRAPARRQRQRRRRRPVGDRGGPRTRRVSRCGSSRSRCRTPRRTSLP